MAGQQPNAGSGGRGKKLVIRVDEERLRRLILNFRASDRRKKAPLLYGSTRAKPLKAETPRAGLPRRLYSIKEASQYLGRSVWALREMLWAGKLPYVRDGRRILLDIRDMDAWIEKNKRREEGSYYKNSS